MNPKGSAWSTSIREARQPKQIGPCKPSLVSPIIAHRSEYPKGPAAAMNLVHDALLIAPGSSGVPLCIALDRICLPMFAPSLHIARRCAKVP